MLLKVLDAEGVLQTVITQTQEAPTDQSGVITTTGVAQDLMAANATRSGWNFQNLGSSDMWLEESGGDAVSGTSWKVPSGGYFPPPGFPVTTSKVSVLGTSGDRFIAREW